MKVCEHLCYNILCVLKSLQLVVTLFELLSRDDVITAIWRCKDRPHLVNIIMCGVYVKHLICLTISKEAKKRQAQDAYFFTNELFYYDHYRKHMHVTTNTYTMLQDSRTHNHQSTEPAKAQWPPKYAHVVLRFKPLLVLVKDHRRQYVQQQPHTSAMTPYAYHYAQAEYIENTSPINTTNIEDTRLYKLLSSYFSGRVVFAARCPLRGVVVCYRRRSASRAPLLPARYKTPGTPPTCVILPWSWEQCC